MATVIYTKTKSHSDDDGDWVPEMASGTDTHNFSIPDGEQYVGYSINVKSQTLLSSYTVRSQPKIGSSGNQKIKIDWFYPVFGKIAYEIKVKSKEPDGTALVMYIKYGENGWERQVIDAIDQGVGIKILFNGAVAEQLSNIIKTQQNVSANSSYAIDPLTASVLLGVIVFGVLGGVLIYAIHKNYSADAKASVETPAGDADLEISLDPK